MHQPRDMTGAREARRMTTPPRAIHPPSLGYGSLRGRRKAASFFCVRWLVVPAQAGNPDFFLAPLSRAALCAARAACTVTTFISSSDDGAELRGETGISKCTVFPDRRRALQGDNRNPLEPPPPSLGGGSSRGRRKAASFFIPTCRSLAPGSRVPGRPASGARSPNRTR